MFSERSRRATLVKNLSKELPYVCIASLLLIVVYIYELPQFCMKLEEAKLC